MQKIVALDTRTLNPGDLDWESIRSLGEFVPYEHSTAAQALERAEDATILVVNKFYVGRELITSLPNLSCICVTATGYNNVDLAAARERNIPVCNVIGYSTPSVVQHVFALLSEMTSKVGEHNQSVQAGEWANQVDFGYTLGTIPEWAGLRFGIYGFGRIGQAVATAALAFGMEVYAHHKHPERDAREGVRFLSLEQLFDTCQIISLHAPLSAANTGIVNRQLIERMPQPSYLINTGRGGLVNDEDLRWALTEGPLTAAGLDTLQQEPPPADHPLIGLPNCIVTPHMAWATLAARKRLLAGTVSNIQAFLQGAPINVVNL